MTLSSSVAHAVTTLAALAVPAAASAAASAGPLSITTRVMIE